MIPINYKSEIRPVAREARHAGPAAVLGLGEAALHQLQPHLHELNYEVRLVIMLIMLTIIKIKCIN